MPSNDTIPASMAYAMRIVELWLQCYEMSIKFRQDAMAHQGDPELSNLYISQLTRLWMELYPKIKDRSDFKPNTFPADYEKYKQYYFDPDKLLDPKNSDDLLNLEMIIREAMEKLALTRFDV